MTRPIRVLHLEDSPRDAEMIHDALKTGGVSADIVLVTNKERFEAALAGDSFDIILSDYNVPGYGGIAAVKLAQERRPETPVIVISGTVGEDEAVRCLHVGATDYLLKQRTERLVPAVQRALREAEERRSHKRLEAQFRQAQKMESVGQLAGGIAHDFNNLLTVINGLAEIGLMQVKASDQLHQDLQEIRAAGERAAALTQQLLAFSRKQILQPRVMNLDTVVTQMASMLRRLIGENIDLVVVPGHNVGNVKADPGQIEQVIVNLVVNARDAMLHGGQLTIETQNVEIGESEAHRPGVAVTPGLYVMLAVSDTGVGIDEITRERIFEPFFTTKAPGRGTGLGLSTVHGIVKQSAGFIRVHSEVGRGTSFKMYLPQVTDLADVLPRRSTVTPLRGAETILIVEDVEGLARLARRMLESVGYTVLTATTGDMALRVLARDAPPVSLMLTDVVMPGMSGQTLAARIGATRPGIRVLYMSGYTDDVVVRHGILAEGTPFLSKPFSLLELTRKVREVLDAER